MGLFWDALRHGVPIVGALGTFTYASYKGWKPIPRVVAGAGGWLGGYLLYRLFSGVTESTESLPTQVTMPETELQGMVPSADQAMNAIASREQLGGITSHDVNPYLEYSNDFRRVTDAQKRNFRGQPPSEAVVIDMATRQVLNKEEPAPTPGIPGPPPPGGSGKQRGQAPNVAPAAPQGIPQAPVQPAWNPGKSGFNPALFDPGGSFGGGGSGSI